MASEVCGQQYVGAQGARYLLAEGRCVEVAKQRLSAPNWCRFLECRSASARYSSPASGFFFGAAEWPSHSNSASFDFSYQLQRPKFVPWTVPEGSPKPLAPFKRRNCLPSPENPSQLSRLDTASGAAESRSDREQASASDRHGTNERKRVLDERGSDSEMSRREPGVDEGGWKLRVMASSRCRSASLRASDVIGTMDFDPKGSLFATGGIARKIRIYSYAKMIGDGEFTVAQVTPPEDMDEDDDEMKISRYKSGRGGGGEGPLLRDHRDAAVGEICTPGKLGSLKWRPDGSDVIGCGDYDGVVMEWDIEHGHTVSERYDHSGQRVWSVDYSKSMPTLSASSSADGTVRLWSRGMDKSHLVLKPDSGNSVCSVEFSPAVDHLLAVGSADAKVYLYDIRRPDSSLLELSGHEKAVSYVRFLSRDQLVSASIDSTLKLWDIAALPADHSSSARLAKTFSAHTNVRHFVGLSIHRGAGLLACGSETDEVFIYSSRSAAPILRHKFAGKRSGHGGAAPQGAGNSYVGAVCWREQDDKYALVAANSDGMVQVLQATHFPS